MHPFVQIQVVMLHLFYVSKLSDYYQRKCPRMGFSLLTLSQLHLRQLFFFRCLFFLTLLHHNLTSNHVFMFSCHIFIFITVFRYFHYLHYGHVPPPEYSINRLNAHPYYIIIYTKKKKHFTMMLYEIFKWLFNKNVILVCFSLGVFSPHLFTLCNRAINEECWS